MSHIITGNSPFKTLIGGAILACLLALMTIPADAARRGVHRDGHRDGHLDGYRWITAESQFDFRTISAPIRSGPVGDQVRLPGGTWLNCEYSCEYTLRANTLDFFLCGEGGPDDCSPGILDDIIARRLR